MKKRSIGSIAGLILIILISGLFVVAIHIWNSRYDGKMIRQMNCGLTSSDVKVELLQEERGGLTGDGVAIYKVSINENCDTSEIDISGWKSLPIAEEIVDYYMVNNYSAGRTLGKLQKGRWKLAGKNKEDGIYANILLFVYDEEGKCFYIYEWDS